jgi:hypothetical protein
VHKTGLQMYGGVMWSSYAFVGNTLPNTCCALSGQCLSDPSKASLPQCTTHQHQEDMTSSMFSLTPERKNGTPSRNLLQTHNHAVHSCPCIHSPVHLSTCHIFSEKLLCKELSYGNEKSFLPKDMLG